MVTGQNQKQPDLSHFDLTGRLSTSVTTGVICMSQRACNQRLHRSHPLGLKHACATPAGVVHLCVEAQVNKLGQVGENRCLPRLDALYLSLKWFFGIIGFPPNKESLDNIAKGRSG